MGARTDMGDFGEEKYLLPLLEFEPRTGHPEGNFNLVVSDLS
jgi:hypothetical protein